MDKLHLGYFVTSQIKFVYDLALASGTLVVGLRSPTKSKMIHVLNCKPMVQVHPISTFGCRNMILK